MQANTKNFQTLLKNQKAKQIYHPNETALLSRQTPTQQQIASIADALNLFQDDQNDIYLALVDQIAESLPKDLKKKRKEILTFKNSKPLSDEASEESDEKSKNE